MTWASLSSILLLSFVYYRMTVSQEINWTALDFCIVGVLSWTFFTCAQLAYHHRHNKKMQWGFVFALVVIALVYIDLAVGIFNLPWSGS